LYYQISLNRGPFNHSAKYFCFLIVRGERDHAYITGKKLTLKTIKIICFVIDKFNLYNTLKGYIHQRVGTARHMQVIWSA